MEFFDQFIIGISLFYSLVIFIICLGLFLLPKSNSSKLATHPIVSIIVSAKNEERDLPGCIASLEKLTYPKDKLRVIMVDDDSTDSSGKIIKEATQKNKHFVALNTKNAPETGLKAKARGVAWGAEHAEGEWLFITDADAEVPPDWIQHMLSGADEKTGMIGGMVTVKPLSLVGLFERVSWAYTLPFAFGFAGYGGSFICVGPNMALRKSIYDNCGGLESTDFKVAEDLALFRMVQTSGYEIKSYMSPDTTVNLKPVDSITHLLSQQRRWLKGGFEGSWEYWIGLVFAFGYHNILSLSLLVGFFISLEATFGALLIKSGADFLMQVCEKVLLKKDKFLRYFPVLEFYVSLTMLWLPISLLINSNIHWKGSDYSIDYSKE